MNEDDKLNSLIKSVLEEKGAFEFKRPQSGNWLIKAAIPTLMAASIMVLAMFWTVTNTSGQALSDAINLLSDIDGVELDEKDSTSERLLEWQDAPYRDVGVGE